MAWLDAIKETEDTPVPVSASTASVDEPVASPYPKDPWLQVNNQPDTPTPPLFRAAVDSVYGPEAAEELPEQESEAADWLGAASSSAVPDSKAVTNDEAPADDPFLAPLKPLPRPDDTDPHMSSFTAPSSERQQEEDKRPADEPEPASAAEEKPSGKDEGSPWADTQPRNELPKWTVSLPGDERPKPEEPSDPISKIEPPQWGETDSETSAKKGERLQWADASDTLPRNELPQWSEPEPRPAEPQDRPQWGGPAQEPPQQVEPVQKLPQRVEPIQEPPQQWTEQQEWRPAEREIPPPPERRRRPAPVPVFTSPPRPPVTGKPTAESLNPESLLRGRRNAPSKGWRRLIYKASGGWIKPGEPPEVRRRRELMTRARTPVTTGHHRVAVLSLKGGVGKTTTTVGLGATLAQMRGDRVIAVDANPDRGTLSDKLVLETSATVRDLLNERDQVTRYVDIRAFTSQAPSRLEVLASDRDPSVSEAFSGSDYQAVSQVLENFYSICITDCGTGLLHSAMGGVLGLADQIVLVSSPSVDGARAASATLDWLEAHHYGDLVKNATVVLCSVRPRSKSAVDIKKLEAHFAARCRAVIRVPYDPHLEEGAEIDLDRLQEPTREAYLQLAASVGDGFTGIRE
ncbi:AAA family ATPase [Nonomuraea sp. NPDC046802]|uniref:MinD/ParA family ATP-binding protein n=1 Tax=Nonomuraea sp. NPDC046802 TaxID=3154919 RepID=UPI0033CF009E